MYGLRRWCVQPAHANYFACEERRIGQRNAVVKNCLALHAAGSLTVDKASAKVTMWVAACICTAGLLLMLCPGPPVSCAITR